MNTEENQEKEQAKTDFDQILEQFKAESLQHFRGLSTQKIEDNIEKGSS